MENELNYISEKIEKVGRYIDFVKSGMPIDISGSLDLVELIDEKDLLENRY